MEVLWVFVFIAVLGGFIAMYQKGLIEGKHDGWMKGWEAHKKLCRYQQTSQQTRQRGTPEQERGSDDTG